MAVDQDKARPSRRRGGFPAPLTILTIVLALVWLASFFIPSGAYLLDETGSPIPGTFRIIEPALSFSERLGQLVLAPVNGLYGALDPETGLIAPFNSGPLFGSAPVFMYTLSIGGFMTVVFATGALDRGIHHLSYRFRAQGPLLIIFLCLLFGMLGTLMSWSDESLALYALITPLMIALRYDRIVAVAVVTVSPFVGRLGSTINPFVTGIGSDKAGITLADGLGLRLLMFAAVITATIAYTLWYARRVRQRPEASHCGIGEEDQALAEADAGKPEPMTRTHVVILGLVAFTFGFMTFSIIPWGAVLDNAKVDPYTHETINTPFGWELGWWLPELTAFILVMSVVVGIAGRLGQTEMARSFIRGVVDFTGPAFLVLMARGISVIMTNTQTIDTVLHAMEGLVQGASSVAFTVMVFAASLPMIFLVGGGSAGTALVMPVLAPLGDFAGIDRSLVLTTWTAAGGWLTLILPTNAIVMAGLALAKVRYDQYLRFMLPLMAILLVLSLSILALGAML